MMDCLWNSDGPPWICQQCDWVYARQGKPILSNKPPRGPKCPKALDIPRRAPEEVVAIEIICTACEEWKKGCQYFPKCSRLQRTKQTWELATCNCPEKKW